MNPEFESVTNTQTSGSTFDVNLPGTVDEGDLLVAHATVGKIPDGVGILTPPEAYQPIFAGKHNDGDCEILAWYRYAGASEPSTEEWASSDSGAGVSMSIIRVSGAAASDPIDDSAEQHVDVDATPTCPSIETSVDDCLVIALTGVRDDVDTTPFAPSGYTGITQQTYGVGRNRTMQSAYKVQASAGTVAAADFSIASSSRNCAGQFAIKPGAAGGETTADLDATLDDAALSSDAAVDVAGDLDATLEDAALDANAAALVLGALAQTLEDASVSASAGPETTAETSAQLDDATLDAAAVAPVTASSSSTLDDATLSATASGQVETTGDLGSVLDDATVESAGEVRVAGSAALTLEGAQLTGAGAVDVSGSLARTLDDATVSALASGTLISGQVAVTLDDATLSASGGLVAAPAIMTAVASIVPKLSARASVVPRLSATARIGP